MGKIAELRSEMQSAFDKTKQDINSVKKSVNRNLAQIGELASGFGNLVSKEEFYSFVRELSDRLDEFEKLFVGKESMEDFEADNRSKLKALEKELKRKEDLSNEVKEIRSLRSRLAALAGSKVDSGQYLEDVQALRKLITDLQKQQAREGTLKREFQQVAELGRELRQLEKRFVDWQSYTKAEKKLEEEKKRGREAFDTLRKEVDGVKLDYVRAELLNHLLEEEHVRREEMTERLKELEEYSTTKDDVKQLTSKLREQLDKVRKDVDGLSVLEKEDLSDYVSKRDMEKHERELSGKIELSSGALSRDARLQGQRAAEALEAVKELGQSVKSLGEELRDARKALSETLKEFDAAKGEMVKAADLRRLNASLASELNQLRTALARQQAATETNLSRLAERLERTERRPIALIKAPKISAEPAMAKREEKKTEEAGIFGKFSRAVGDFFEEEPEEEMREARQEQKKLPKKEFPKREQREF